MIVSRLRALTLALALALVTLLNVSALHAEEERVRAPVPFLSIDPKQTGARLQVNFPTQANGDANRLLYHLEANEDLELDLQVFAGRDEVGFPIRLFVTLLVDGQQAKFRLGEVGAGADDAVASVKRELTVPSPGTVVQAWLSLAGTRLSSGLHSIDLLIWRADGVPFPCWSFLAMKGAPGPSVPPSKAFVRSSTGSRPAADFQLSSSLEPLFGPLRQVPASALGSLSLRVHFERSARDRESLELGVVALLDGKQVSFRSSGKCPQVEVGPRQSADAELRLSALPAQSTGHRLIFFLVRRPSLENLRAFLEIPFSPTRQIGGVKW